jgi:hypothetical protein
MRSPCILLFFKSLELFELSFKFCFLPLELEDIVTFLIPLFGKKMDLYIMAQLIKKQEALR